MTVSSSYVWEGDDSLRPLLVPIDSVSPHPENPRRGDVVRIGESLRRFGQKRPILVQESTGLIVAGNHTWLAAGQEMGWSAIAAVVAEMTDDDALAYLITDNRTAELGGYDDAGLIAVLSRLQEAGQLEGTGYTADEVDDAIAANAALVTDPEPFHGGHSESEETLAAREAARAAVPIMREVVLMFEPERYARFGGFVKILQKEYGATGTIETVYEAVEREARRVNADGAETT